MNVKSLSDLVMNKRIKEFDRSVDFNGMKIKESSSIVKPWYVLFFMCTVLFIISIDSSVLNFALPSISNTLGASASQLQWIVDSYTLVFASLLITTGSIGDRFGRKKLLLIGLALFGIGSLGAALSSSTTLLIGFRALLGLAGAMVMPSTLSILSNVFQEPKERAKAIAIWSSIFSVGAGIGPIIGGLLINSFHWSAVFYLNIPVVIISIIGSSIYVPESRDINVPKPDLPGVALSSIGLASIVFGVILSGDKGWMTEEVLFPLILGVLSLYAFIRWEIHSKNPMLPMHFFKNLNFSGANAGLTLSAFGLMGSLYFFSQFLQSVQVYTPILAAIGMLPLTISIFVFTLLSVKVDQRLGAKITICIGLLISGLGLFIFSQFANVNSSYWLILLVQVIIGNGAGFTTSPATNSIMNSLPLSQAGVGSAMNDTTRQLGGALGIAVLGALMNGTYRSGINQIEGIKGIDVNIIGQIRSSIQGAHIAASTLSVDLGTKVIQISNQSFVQGMKEAFFFSSIIMVLASLATWILLPAKHIDNTSLQSYR